LLGVALLGLLTIAAAGTAQADAFISAQVSSSQFGQSMGPAFVGVSAEYSAIPQYAGSNPRYVDPVLVRLLRALAPSSRPVLRVGGDSADHTWWPVSRVKRPRGVSYKLTKRWLKTAHALAVKLSSRMIMGINLAINKPPIAAVEAQMILRALGRNALEAFEIGNEPDLYGTFVWYRDKRGHIHSARPPRYNLHAYIRQFTQYRTALPVGPFAGPAFAGLNWMKGLRQFLASERHIALVTFHRYPLRACEHDPTASGYPTIPRLLSDSSSARLARLLAPYVAETHGHGIPFRLDEMNSVACRGRRGVSDTFASALWALDTLFNMASVGVDGVNLHTLPHAAYELFTVSHRGRSWRAFVRPEYYGLLMFAKAFPPGARLLNTSAPAGPVKIWATQAPEGRLRVTLINKDTANAAHLQLQLPGPQTPARAQALTAPSVSSRSGVTYGGQTFGSSTSTGTLPPPHSTTVGPLLGRYSVDLPAGSALLLIK
jgi:Glycosyl hydrolase family 79 C-terminal beta domain